MHGNVHGGQQPVSGSIIQLWVINANAAFNGGPGTKLGTATITDANGNFAVPPFTCNSLSDFLYMTAVGGNPGLAAGTNNPSIEAMTILDDCADFNQPSQFVQINELTTAAAVFSFGEFMLNSHDIGYTEFNYGPGYLDTINFENIVDKRTGTSPGPKLGQGTTYPFPTLNLLANIIATCVNSAGGVAGDSSPCGRLFSLTTIPGQPAPVDTVQALINIQHNPFLNLKQLTDLTSPSAPYEPTLTIPPDNWYMRTSIGPPTTPRYALCTEWGDSLTRGGEDGHGSFPITLATLSACYQSNNKGVPLQTSTQIAVREGGLATTATVAGDVIPASGPVTISFPTGFEPVIPTGPVNTPLVLSNVAGTVSFNFSTGVTEFTRDVAGTPTFSPPSSPFKMTIDSQNDQFVTIWLGRNNIGQPDQIFSDVAAIVHSLPAKAQYLVLSTINNSDASEWAGTTTHSNIVALNQRLAAAYPNNYLDVRSLFIANYDPNNAEDVIDHNHDVPPSSMRAQDLYAQLAAAIDATTCNLHAPGALLNYYTITIDQEKILITAGDGSNSTSCVRGYASTVPAPHAAATNFSGVDTTHIGYVGFNLMSTAIDAWVRAH